MEENMKAGLLSVVLARQDWGQAMDGLQVRAETWRRTEEYLKGQEVDGDVEECSHPDEARDLARTYERIIGEIEKALSGSTGKKTRKPVVPPKRPPAKDGSGGPIRASCKNVVIEFGPEDLPEVAMVPVPPRMG